MDIRQSRISGAKLYKYQGNLSSLFDEWCTLDFNVIFADISLVTNQRFRTLARQYGIAVFVILPVFYNPQALAYDPGLYAITDRGDRAQEEWVQFVCPSRRDYLLNFRARLSELVRECEPDGISLDFIRHFVYWEKVYEDRNPESLPSSCFDPGCVDAFQRASGVTIPSDLKATVEVAHWIRTNCAPMWVSWKCDVVVNTVRELVDEAKKWKPDVLVNLHAVPWRESDFGGAIKTIAGQDFVRLAGCTDYISPMCYSHMLKRKPDWITEVVRDIHRQSGSSILPSIQVKEHYLSKRLTVAEFRVCLEQALQTPSRGVVFWSWEALEADPDKKKVILDGLGAPT